MFFTGHNLASSQVSHLETEFASENASDNLARYLCWKTLLVTFFTSSGCFR